MPPLLARESDAWGLSLEARVARVAKASCTDIKTRKMDLAIAAGQNDSLIEQLSFSLPAVATYARELRLVQVMPQGGEHLCAQQQPGNDL